uniref:Uncharacterized protein n=1 Tax=Anopheles funestus TaxID=62324 RepID=A0A4Y0BPQ0_ANOFN
MLPKILYVLQEAGTTVSMEEIMLRVERLDARKSTSEDDCSRLSAFLKALDQGMQFGFIVGDRKRRMYKLGVNYLRFENYKFNIKLRMLSEDIAIHGLHKILSNVENVLQSDVSNDSSDDGDGAAYDSDDERTPTPKKKIMRNTQNISKQRKKRIFKAGATPKKLPARSKYNKR